MKRPTMQEIADYFKQQMATTQLATAFFERYEANGWTVTEPASEKNHWRTGRRPMKDWKRAAKCFVTQYQLQQKRRTYNSNSVRV